MSRKNPEENFERFPIMMPPSQSAKVEDYRAEFRPVPSKGEAIRDLIDMGLEVYWENKKNPDQE